jgi:hypothetical protein
VPTPVYLSLDGVEIPVNVNAGGLLEPERSGETVRMHDNSLRTTEDASAAKRVWAFTTIPLVSGDVEIVRALLRGGVPRTADGYAITREAGAVSVFPRLGRITHVEYGPADFRYVVAFTLHEISGLQYGGVVTSLTLANLVSPDDTGANAWPAPTSAGGPLMLISPDVSGAGVSSGPVTTAEAVECATEDCIGRCDEVITDLMTWRAPGVPAPAILDGFAQVSVLAIGPAGGSPWARIAFTGQLEIVRAGVVVAGPFQFGYMFPFFAGGTVSAFTVSPLAVGLEAGDQPQFTLQSALALLACGTDNGLRPSYLYGGSWGATLTLPGTLVYPP